MTPDQWLARLTKAMDDRAERLARLRSYMDGNAPLPEGADGCREAYADFQKKARTNFGELIVEAVAERLIPSGFTLNGEQSDDDQLRAIWKRNRLKVGITEVIRDMVGLSAGYLIVGEGQPRQALITCERPEQVITEQSASRPDQVRAGLKVYRDEVEGVDVAKQHLPGVVFSYKRDLRGEGGAFSLPMRVSGDWVADGSESTRLNFVPFFPFLNRGGLGEFEPHTDILDRINWDILQRLVITAMQAYRQRALTTDSGEPLPTTDADGNEIDYDELFSASPGALWEMPPGFKVWESQQTDVTGILSAAKDDIRDLAAVTRTPLPMLIPDGANQSADGARAAREGLVFKSRDRMNRADAALVAAMGAALAIERGESALVEGVEVSWEPLERRSLQEMADADTKAQSIPWRDRMEYIWGFSGDRIDNMESNRAADSLVAGLQNPPTPPGPVNGADQQQA